MRIKSYFADSVSEAMEKARRELGPDAMLLNSKKTEVDLRTLGEYEVVFAIPPEGKNSSLSGVVSGREPASAHVEMMAPPAALPRADAGSSAGELARELAELRKQIESVKRTVVGRPPSAGAGGAFANPSEAEMIAELESADFSFELASEMAQSVNARKLSESLPAAWRGELERRVRFSPGLPRATSPGVVLLAGPSGSGKTTTLIKLAIRCAIEARRPVQLLTLDTLRIGAAEQLAAYARIAGLPCEVVHTPAALDRILKDQRGKKLLLIDTPGVSPGAGSMLGWLAARRQEFETQVVLSAVTQVRANLRLMERLAPLAPAKLIFSHLDEAESRGPLLETAIRTGLPLSYLATGPQVPEDLHEASWDEIGIPSISQTDTLRSSERGGRIASAA